MANSLDQWSLQYAIVKFKQRWINLKILRSLHQANIYAIFSFCMRIKTNMQDQIQIASCGLGSIDDYKSFSIGTFFLSEDSEIIQLLLAT